MLTESIDTGCHPPAGKEAARAKFSDGEWYMMRWARRQEVGTMAGGEHHPGWARLHWSRTNSHGQQAGRWPRARCNLNYGERKRLGFTPLRSGTRGKESDTAKQDGWSPGGARRAPLAAKQLVVL